MTNPLKQPIIFIGAPRSGTTIISEIIMQHSELAWPSNYQEKFPRHTSINHIRKLFDNKLWKVIGNKKQLYYTSILSNYFFKPGENYKMWEYITGTRIQFSKGFLIGEKANYEEVLNIRNYFSQMVINQGKKRLIFKVTGPPRIEYLMSIFPDAKFILIRRNFVPVISSLLKVWFWKNLGLRKLWWNGPYNNDEKKWAVSNTSRPELLTAFQLKTIRWAEELEAKKIKPDLMIINYEDFVYESMKTIDEVLDFCELPYDNQINKYLVSNPIVSRNKKDTDYFNAEMLKSINEVLSS